MAKKKEEILQCSLGKDKGRGREISPALELYLSLRREEEGQAAAAEPKRKVSMSTSNGIPKPFWEGRVLNTSSAGHLESLQSLPVSSG